MQINDPFELILFGGLGDLARRKLLPALYMLHRDGRLGEGIICAVTRQQPALRNPRSATAGAIPATAAGLKQHRY